MEQTTNQNNGPENSEIPAENLDTETKIETQNELPSLPQVTAKAPVAERIFQAGASVFEAAGKIIKKGRGRPRNDGQPGKLDVVAPVQPSQAVAPAAAVAPCPEPIDEALVSRCLSAISKTADRMGRWAFTWAKSKKIGRDRAEILASDLAMTKEEHEAIAELALLCAKKRGISTKDAPEWALVAVVAGIGVRYAEAFAADEKRAEESKK